MENPLQGYYRHKDLYVKLPTLGKWLKNKPNLTDDGEVAARPIPIKIPKSKVNQEPVLGP